MNKDGIYRRNEIKHRIDIALEKTMFDCDKEKWDAILEMKDRLYEELEIID